MIMWKSVIFHKKIIITINREKKHLIDKESFQIYKKHYKNLEKMVYHWG